MWYQEILKGYLLVVKDKKQAKDFLDEFLPLLERYSKNHSSCVLGLVYLMDKKYKLLKPDSVEAEQFMQDIVVIFFLYFKIGQDWSLSFNKFILPFLAHIKYTGNPSTSDAYLKLELEMLASINFQVEIDMEYIKNIIICTNDIRFTLSAQKFLLSYFAPEDFWIQFVTGFPKKPIASEQEIDALLTDYQIDLLNENTNDLTTVILTDIENLKLVNKARLKLVEKLLTFIKSSDLHEKELRFQYILKSYSLEVFYEVRNNDFETLDSASQINIANILTKLLNNISNKALNYIRIEDYFNSFGSEDTQRKKWMRLSTSNSRHMNKYLNQPISLFGKPPQSVLESLNSNDNENELGFLRYPLN